MVNKKYDYKFKFQSAPASMLPMPHPLVQSPTRTTGYIYSTMSQTPPGTNRDAHFTGPPIESFIPPEVLERHIFIFTGKLNEQAVILNEMREILEWVLTHRPETMAGYARFKAVVDAIEDNTVPGSSESVLASASVAQYIKSI